MPRPFKLGLGQLDEIRSKYMAGSKMEQLAVEYGVSYATIRNSLEYERGKLREQREQQRTERATALRQQHMTVHEIAKELGISPTRVTGYIERGMHHDEYCPLTTKTGNRCNCMTILSSRKYSRLRPPKISQEQAEEIRSLYKVPGITQVKLAKQYNISQATVSLIVNGFIH